MKPTPNISAARRQAGILLTECLVYLAVFVILFGIATAAFYFCWDHTRAVIITANEVESALRAGETWRADVRGATGTISLERTPAGETVKIVKNGREIFYHQTGGEVRREIPAQKISRLLLNRVKASAMAADPRAGVAAWHWELELTPRRKEAHFPLLFTFAAAREKP